MLKLLLALAGCACALVAAYDEKFDKLDVDKILADDKMFSSYLKCLLDEGPCDLEYSEDFKKLLPEVIATGCEKCTPAQKGAVRKSVKAIQERQPESFLKFRDKYDPQGEHEKKFTEFLLGDA